MKSDGLTLYFIFSMKSASTLLPCTKDKQVCVCLVGTMPCPAHIARYSVHESHHPQTQTLYHRFLPSGLKVCGSLRVLDWNCQVDRVTLSNQILWWLPEFSDLSVALHCHAEAGFLLNSCEARLVWNDSWVLSLSWCKRQSWLSHLSELHPQESLLHSPRRWWSWPCLVKGTFIFFLLGSLRMVPFHGYSVPG